jgi:phosphatidylglycerol:prolipoprotein diacylglycerol transferase
MHPVLFHVSYLGIERTIYSYGVMALLGMAAALATACARAPRRGIARFDMFAFGALCIAGGLGGAWVLYLIVQWRAVLAAPLDFFRAAGIGMVFYGGFVGAAGAGLWYARRYTLPLAVLADLTAPSLALGHALGRIGCFLGGCCFGHPTQASLGVMFLDEQTAAGALCRRVGPLHPVQLYESAGLLGIALLLFLAERRLTRHAQGLVFTAYLLLYAVLRLGTEQFRGDPVERGQLIPGLATSETLALVMIALGVALLVRIHRRGKRAVEEGSPTTASQASGRR